MKEEEIRPIAENYVEEYCHLPDGEYTDGSLVCAGIGTALIVSRQLEKRIAELEKELEQAKKVQVVEHFEAYGQCRDSRRIASLEQENASLKAYNEKLLDGDIEKHNKIVELNDKLNNLSKVAEVRLANWQKYEKENKELKELVEKYRQAVDKCLHITFMGGGCEVNTIGQYATLVDGYLTDVEGLAKWKK